MNSLFDGICYLKVEKANWWLKKGELLRSFARGSDTGIRPWLPRLPTSHHSPRMEGTTYTRMWSYRTVNYIRATLIMSYATKLLCFFLFRHFDIQYFCSLHTTPTRFDTNEYCLLLLPSHPHYNKQFYYVKASPLSCESQSIEPIHPMVNFAH